METKSPALAVARAYHDAWSAGAFVDASALLSHDLAIEVPINSYATKSDFMDAVARTSQMSSDVTLLAEFGNDQEAILLYDMAFRFGKMRVAEHFTVQAGRISRIRQIHDTAAIRAAMASAHA